MKKEDAQIKKLIAAPCEAVGEEHLLSENVCTYILLVDDDLMKYLTKYLLTYHQQTN